jgi:hypothetical protein
LTAAPRRIVCDRRSNTPASAKVAMPVWQASAAQDQHRKRRARTLTNRMSRSSSGEDQAHRAAADVQLRPTLRRQDVTGVGAQHRQRSDRGRAHEPVEQDGDAPPPRGGTRRGWRQAPAAERGGEHERIVNPAGVAGSARSMAACLRSRPASSTPVPTAQRATTTEQGGCDGGCGRVSDAISPRRTRSASGETAS